ncbi:hypothetical protein GX48_05326 [Paracoccidioides brasiliensis]|nr:hypothetical protein GX48_05326 [Paracoccidioides brasiliensis]
MKDIGKSKPTHVAPKLPERAVCDSNFLWWWYSNKNGSPCKKSHLYVIAPSSPETYVGWEEKEKRKRASKIRAAATFEKTDSYPLGKKNASSHKDT